MTTTLTPRRCAASALAQKCTLVATRSAPQATIRSAVVDRFRVGAADRADGHVPGLLAARVAHGAGDQPAGAERVEQAEHQAAVDLPLMRAVGVAEQRQRPRLGDDRLPARGDLVERLVPGDRREFALALGADAAQRRLDALGRMHEFGVAVDLGAGEPGGEGLLRVAAARARTRPSSTSASSEHMSGQSCAQTTRIVSMPSLVRRCQRGNAIASAPRAERRQAERDCVVAALLAMTSASWL